MSTFYTNEKHAQILVTLLKAHGIKKVIASPGSANAAFVASIQYDPFFEVYSSVDERSAAYMACGLSSESGEPVVISCTGATASRNYLPGLTEAFYRKLPILSVTSTNQISKVGHNVPQVIDRSQLPFDTCKHSVLLPLVYNDEEFWDCEIKVNRAILELQRNGGGPVHINLPTDYDTFDTKELPSVNKIVRYTYGDDLPKLPSGSVAIFIGSHCKISTELSEAIDMFCSKNNAVVFCDHTSGYNGSYKIMSSLLGGQIESLKNFNSPDLTIHIGEVSGDYYTSSLIKGDVWRVSSDGEIRDTFKKLKNVFELEEVEFFKWYLMNSKDVVNTYFKDCSSRLEELKLNIQEIPFSNIWAASQMAQLIPQNSTVHFAILNSLRSWNFFSLPDSVVSASNVGGFGIDGCISSLLGASLHNQNKLYYLITGDLAFFYDMNSIGNRHIGNNIRILLINNGLGTEFKQFNHRAASFKEAGNDFVAASGHFGNKSRDLVKNYSKSLGFDYLTASSKAEFMQVYRTFLSPEIGTSMIFEMFTGDVEESKALQSCLTLETNIIGKFKNVTKQILRRN
jgi:2-succinyl-5-enolpyruvyl-6-hydroxy-3-cyclohexene-1-carboxylate synthase